MMNSQPLLDFLKSELSTIEAAHEAPWAAEWILAKELDENSSRQLAAEIIQRRRQHEPLAYIFGQWAFRDLEIAVGPGALIPRPETEELVDLVLEKVLATKTVPVEINFADLGSGTGAIGYALACELSNRLRKCKITMSLVEASEDASKYLVKNNALIAELSSVKCRLELMDWNDWAAATKPSSMDFIVSNPPYISRAEWESLDAGVKNFEPVDSLIPKKNPEDPEALACYREILQISERLLKSGGWLFFEMGSQTKACLEMIRALPGYQNAMAHSDMAKKSRFISCQKVL